MTIESSLNGQLLGPYTLDELLGRGGMGAVYRATGGQQSGPVAVKVMALGGGVEPREVERFRREAQLAAQLDHPAVVKIYAAGQTDDWLYMAMELIEGQSVRQLLQRSGRLPQEQSLGVAAQVLGALDAAHGQQIVHRDIKAENVLVRPDGVAKVLDFGVAKLQGGTALTQVNEILGTVEDMAPEQILGEGVGPATDLYATGVLLYEMLTGVLPFVGESPATLVYHQLNEEPNPPSALNDQVSKALDHFVLQLLDKLPENRPASAAEALQQLQEVQRRQALLAVSDAEGHVEDEAERPLARAFEPRFVGRRQALKTLDGYVQELRAGGEMAFIVGEAGSGKSRLVQQWGQSSGVRLVKGSCFFEHSMGPYMPFLDALGDLFGNSEVGLSAEARQDLGALLADEAPELADLAAQSTTTAKVRAGFSLAFGAEGPGGRQRLFDTVFAVLAAAGAHQPMAVLLEDMHWADEGSLQLLQYVRRRAAEAQVLWLVSYRPEELAGEDGMPSLEIVLNQLEEEGDCHQVRLEPLAAEEVGQLASSALGQADLGKEFIETLHQHTHGNPFLAVEMLKLLHHQEVLYCESGVWTVRGDFQVSGVPQRVNALIMRRIDPLDEEDRELLQVAAVLGQHFDTKVLQAASGMRRIPLLKALFRLEKRHHLVEATEGGYAFSQGKVREVLYEEIPLELQAEYHHMVADILLELNEEGEAVDDGELAHHLYKAEAFAAAVPYLRRAGDQCRRLFGWRAAAVLYEQLITACRQTNELDDNLCYGLKAASQCYGLLGLGNHALERAEELKEAAVAAGDNAVLGEAWGLIGTQETSLRHFEAAAAAFVQALKCLGKEQYPQARARILLNWGIADFECGHYDRAETHWQQARILQEEAGQVPREALNNLAVLATVRGELDQAWKLYEKVLELEEEHVSPEMVLTLFNMGMVQADLGHWDEALALYRRSLEICHQTRYWIQEPVIELNRAEALLGKGERGAARGALAAALRLFKRLDDGLGVADALRLQGQLCRLEERWEEGREYLEKSIELNRQYGQSISLGEAFCELGLLCGAQGQKEAAVAALEEAEKLFIGAQAKLDVARVRQALVELKQR